MNTVRWSPRDGRDNRWPRSRSAQPDLADLVFGQHVQGFGFDDPDDAGCRLAGAHQTDRAILGGYVAVLFEGVGVGVKVARDAATHGGHQRHLGHAVSGAHRRRCESGRSKHVGDPLDGAAANGLGAVERDLPSGQVQVGELLWSNPARDQVVGEIRCGGDGSAVIAERLQQPDRLLQECQWRHSDEVGSIEEREQLAEEAHVMPVRDPADQHRRGAGSDGFGHRGLVVHHVAVGDGDALWVTRRPGRVLKERDAVGREVRHRPRVRIGKWPVVDRHALRSGRSRSNPSIPAVSSPRSFSVVNAKLLSASRSIPATRFMLRSSRDSGVGTATTPA